MWCQTVLSDMTIKSYSLNLEIACFSLTVVMECLVDIEIHVVCCLLCKWLLRVTDHTSLLSNAVQAAKRQRSTNESLKKIWLPLVCFMHFADPKDIRQLWKPHLIRWSRTAKWGQALRAPPSLTVGSIQSFTMLMYSYSTTIEKALRLLHKRFQMPIT